MVLRSLVPVSHVRNSTGLLENTDYTWEFDQLIITRRILENNLCSLDGDNLVWAKVNLEYQPSMSWKFVVISLDKQCLWIPGKSFEDGAICFKGDRWDNCNIGRPRFGNKPCLWWHFYRHETALDFHKKYLTIMRKAGVSPKPTAELMIRTQEEQ